jgi:phosphoglycolate phosphatase
LRYRLAIFDFDGTLADSGFWLVGVLKELAPRFGFNAIKDEDHQRVRVFSSAQFLEYIDLPAWKLPGLMAAVRTRARRDAHLIPIHAGVDEMLAGLKAGGVTTAIVSSNAEAAIRVALGTKTSANVDYFSCGASLFGKHMKLRQVLRRSNIKAGEAIYVGDEIRDGTAARKVGMAFGAVSWGYNASEALAKENPNLVFESVGDVAAKLKGWNPIAG